MEFKKALKHWMMKPLEISNQDGLAGFRKFNSLNGKWENCYYLLEGIAGIGLSMISYLDCNLMDRDECLLLK
jgi:hypothetical protein